ncbi:MAG: ABC transporter substrate-binding protein [Chloroflexi bacterium]|nr:MAG: ABC transporter substrate-binding protein [Chloroflexota bacterium]
MRARLYALGAAVAVVLAACGGGTPGAQTSASIGPKADIKVGLAISLTGAANIYGPAQQKGAQLAAEQINAAGGVNGAKIVLVIEDDASARDQGITVFRKLINEDKVAAILGPTLSGVAAGAHPVAQQAGIPVIAISNTGIGIVGKCDYGACDWIFRASLGEESALPAALKAAKDKLNLKKVVLMFESDQKFAADGADIFKKAAADNGITISRTIPYRTADVDFSAFVTQAKGESPDAILASGLAGTASKVLIEVGKQFPQGLRVVGSNGFNSPAVIQAAGAAAPNMIVGTAWNKASTDKVNADFVKAFKDKYSADPDQFATQAYTALIVLADAMKRSGNPADKPGLKKALEGTKDFATPLGAFSFTPDHDVKQPVFVMTVKDGQFVPFN